MRLDRYDAIGTLGTALAGAAYWAHVADRGFLAGPRVASLTILLAGLGACAGNGSRPGTMEMRSAWTTALSLAGMAALVCGLTGLTLGSETAVAATWWITVAAWAVTTVKHLGTAPPVIAAPEPARELTKAGT